MSCLGETALLMKLSNDVEKYEIEVTKMGQNYSFYLMVALLAISYYRRDYLGTCVSTINILKSTVSVHNSIIGYDLS